MPSPSAPAAQDIAVEAFAHLAAEDDLLMRFANITGILPADMRRASGEANFLPAVLDFFLSHEPDLLAFCKASGVAPEQVVAARHQLAPNDHAGWEQA